MTDTVIRIETNETVVVTEKDVTVTSFGIQGPKGSIGDIGAINWGVIGGNITNQTDLNTALNSKEPANANIQLHITDINNPHGTNKAHVGLGNVNNTSDLDKPISTATQTALDLKLNISDSSVFVRNDQSGSITGTLNTSGLNVTGTTDLSQLPTISTVPLKTALAMTAADVGADSAGTAASLISAHEALTDPHPTYLTQVEGNLWYADILHNHDLVYAALSHDHTGLSQSSGATRANIELPASPTNGHVLTWDSASGKLKPAAAAGGGGDPAGWVEIERIQWSVSVAFVDINLRAGQYKILRLVGEAGKPLVSGGNSLHITLSVDNGASFVASGYRYNGTQYQDNASAFTNGNTAGTNGWQLGSGNPQRDSLFIDIRLRPSQNTDMTPNWAVMMDFDVNNRSNNSTYGSQRHLGTGAVALTAAPTTMRIRMTSAGAPMTYGDLRLMGVAT